MSAPVAAARSTLTHRNRAILRAVATGSAELVAGAEPDIYLDGLACSDQFAAHRLVHAGLIAAMGPARTGHRIPARLTADGTALLAALSPRTHDEREPGLLEGEQVGGCVF